jgi:hypothetical protein
MWVRVNRNWTKLRRRPTGNSQNENGGFTAAVLRTSTIHVLASRQEDITLQSEVEHLAFVQPDVAAG